MNRTALDHRDGAVDLRGILVSDDMRSGRRPGLVLFPDARGINSHALECADRLAALGFAVLVADLYGGGITARDIVHARELMGALRSDVTRWRARAEAARQALVQQGIVDPARVAAIGYCFGGTTALELGRSGAPLAALVTFHGGLASPRPEDARNIRARVLVCHGAADVLVPMTVLASFQEEMSKTNVDWQVHVYGSAAHGFTNAELDRDPLPGHAYHRGAEQRSWAAMLRLFDETFGAIG
ncbi:MAG TPA: dienelactone hydrolase family protein [Bradyrhizobium sp.]|uniref:dienelactone hydrolase family protein n=1 Tax=Bradyrhizobium sp. TaxID=376 RepID=UPI002C5AC6D1|nr:dienelactone hydrolase family protein [Bradyrhizobium sp.]HLZ05356.1 dienelactone hydrolase family protein [Bradyrhizobium sp.]